MQKEILFTPWRSEFVVEKKRNTDGCIFDILPTENNDPQNFIIYRTNLCFAILNLYPYTTGHTLIVPYRHTSDILSITTEEFLEINQTTQLIIRALSSIYHPEGFNIGTNIGSASGAGIPEHLHWHIVPRWSGDTGFMGSIGNTRMIPEDLSITYQKIVEALNNGA